MTAQLSGHWMSQEHLLFEESVRKFVIAEIEPNIEKWSKQGVVDQAVWKEASKVGLLNAHFPEEFGGAAVDKGFEAIITYQLARSGDLGFGWGLHNICSNYILLFGTPEQQQRWLPGLAAGEIIPALAMTEPGTGSDVQAVKTTAVLEGEFYRINGSKTFISNGQTANLILVVAKTDPSAGGKGISIVAVETDGAEGFRRGRNLEKLGMKSQDTSELFFDDVLVPSSNLLGEAEGCGFGQLMSELAWERLQIGISALGACDFIFDETIAYTTTRRAFGKTLSEFQNTRFKLAEVKANIEVMRSFINDSIAKLINGELDAATACMTKFWCSEVQCKIADECLQLFGGYGYMMEYPIARAYADARVQKIYGGSNEIQREIVARSLFENGSKSAHNETNSKGLAPA